MRRSRRRERERERERESRDEWHSATCAPTSGLFRVCPLRVRQGSASCASRAPGEPVLLLGRPWRRWPPRPTLSPSGADSVLLSSGLAWGCVERGPADALRCFALHQAEHPQRGGWRLGCFKRAADHTPDVPRSSLRLCWMARRERTRPDRASVQSGVMRTHS
jgi:hypothetical protein